MTKIKLCGLMRPCDIETANLLMPEYIGFVFAKNSKRYVSCEQAAALKKMLHPDITAVGVFVDADREVIKDLLDEGIIDAVQLHGREDEGYIRHLRSLTDKLTIKAFRVEDRNDIKRAQESPADYVLLDSGKGGTGTAFDWQLLTHIDRPYFLAGGLDADTVGEAVRRWRPYVVDVSSGIETDGYKDAEKMRAFVEKIRNPETVNRIIRNGDRKS